MRGSLAFLLFPLLALLALVPALADSARVTGIVDGDTLVLEDGRRVRLAGVEAPKPPHGRRHWPLAETAKTALEALALDRTVALRHDAAEDRYGRRLAQLYRDDGVWLQGEMLRRGLARVHTWADTRALAAEMLAIEAEARSAGRGLWSQRFYGVRTPEDIERDLDSFQIVEGRVLDAQKVKGQVFLNFGPDWRTDFTARIAKRDLRLFTDDPLALKGATIRVRGWISLWNGALIDVTHPEQIETVASPVKPEADRPQAPSQNSPQPPDAHPPDDGEQSEEPDR